MFDLMYPTVPRPLVSSATNLSTGSRVRLMVLRSICQFSANLSKMTIWELRRKFGNSNMLTYCQSPVPVSSEVVCVENKMRSQEASEQKNPQCNFQFSDEFSVTDISSIVSSAKPGSIGKSRNQQNCCFG